MRVAFCSPGTSRFSDYRSGNLLGTEHQIWGLARALLQRGNEVYILRRWGSGDSGEETVGGVTLASSPSSGPFGAMSETLAAKATFSLRMRERIKRIEPDRLILTELVTSLFLATLPIHKVFATHNPPSGFGSHKDFFGFVTKRTAEHFVFSNCTTIVALNEATRSDLERRGYKSIQIPNAVDIAKYPLRDGTGNFVLAAGRFERTKGLHHLLEAYSQIEETLRKEHRLVMIGFGPEKTNLEERAVNLGVEKGVDFLNWQPNSQFIQSLAESAVFVLPSSSESFPVTLIEAMACGKPVIVTNIPGPKDIVKHGYNGLVFDPGDVGALRTALESVLGDKTLRKRLGANARRSVEERFTFDKIAKEYELAFQMPEDD